MAQPDRRQTTTARTTRHEDRSQAEAFIRYDLWGAAAGLGLVAVVNFFVVQEPGVWAIVPFLLLLIAALSVAQQQLRAGRLVRALGSVMAGNWLIAIAVSVMFPFLWPVMALTVLMPVVLATPYLAGPALVAAIGGGALVAGIAAAIGLVNDDGGIVVDIDDTLELILVVGALAAQVVPIGLIVWQNNRLHSVALDRAHALNQELTSAQQALADSRRRVVEAADAARSRIERDLHDGAQQRLVALGIRLRLMDSQTPDGAEAGPVAGLVDDLDAALDDLRSLAHGIYPPLLASRGLGEAVLGVIRRSPLDISEDIGELRRHPRTVESAFYFTCLEALANVTKHAPEARVEVRLSDEGALSLVVVDDGPGFDSHDVPTSKGLTNMADRMAVVGGELEVTSVQGVGTTVSASLVTDPAATL